jgi:hypothetical protein
MRESWGERVESAERFSKQCVSANTMTLEQCSSKKSAWRQTRLPAALILKEM